MRYVILFTDNPSSDPGLRKTHMPRHLQFLAANASKILEAGPLFTEAGAGDGGMWVVEADSTAEVEALVRADPFWDAGLRHSHRVLGWTRVFHDGKSAI